MTQSRWRSGAFALAVLAGAMPVAALVATPVNAASSSKPVAPAAAAQSDLPNISVTDLKTKKAVKLTTLTAAKKPVLLWFWAPH